MDVSLLFIPQARFLKVGMIQHQLHIMNHGEKEGIEK